MPDEPGGGADWREAVELLRRRGYLGGGKAGRGGGSGLRRPAEAVGLGVLLAVGASLGAVAPPSAGGVVVTALLIWLPLFVSLAAVAALSGRLLEVVHRNGLDGARTVGIQMLVAAVASGGAWLWLSAASPLGRWHPARLAGAVLALVAAVGLSRLAALALAARLLRRTPELRFALPRAAWALGAATVLVAAGLLVPAHRRPAVPPGEPLRVRPHPAHLAVLGVDGLPLDDFRLVAREEGLGAAAWPAAPLKVSGPADSIPVAWVTVATGVRPMVHGVTSVRQVVLPLGAPAVLAAPGARRVLLLWRALGLVGERAVPAAQRRVPALWEMVSRAGMAVRVAGWWGSFPPRRVTGLVASERWLFTGRVEPGTVYPESAAPALPRVPGDSPLDMDQRAALVMDGADDGNESLVMGYFPGWWLERRRTAGGPLTVAGALRPHVALLAGTAEDLQRRGWAVWIVALDGRGGGWVASSRARTPAGPVAARELAATWLDQMGLPVPAGAPGPRRDLSGVDAGVPVPTAAYGGPPPLAEATPREEGAAQLELIRSLGYLR